MPEPKIEGTPPFAGFALRSVLGGGKQKKAKYTGFYAYGPNPETAEISVLKKSEDYPADNVAEVISSSLLSSIIGEKNTIPYTFVKSTDDGLYLKSDVRGGFQDLEGVFKKNLNKKNKNKNKKNKNKNKNKKNKNKKLITAFHKFGWIASNPNTNRNKKNIDACFGEPDSLLRKDMSKVLAGCLLVGDADCQVKNICFYTDENQESRIAKFDDGWGLADICKPKNSKVDLFESLSSFGDRATHKNSGLPTNHFVDYPYILHSLEFANTLKETAEKAKNDLDNTVNHALQHIDDAYGEDTEGLKQAYKDFAAHLGIKLNSENLGEIKNTIKTQLSSSLESRADSMLVLSEVLKIKIKIDNGESVSIAKDCQELIKLLEKSENPRAMLPNFKNAKKPFLQKKEAQQTLKLLLNLTITVVTLKKEKPPIPISQPPIFKSFNPSHPPSVLIDHNSSISKIKNFLEIQKTRKNLEKEYYIENFAIKEEGMKNENIELHFKENSNTHKVYIQPALGPVEKTGITYSMDNQVAVDKQEQVINNICKLAVDAAVNTPNAEFDLAHTPPHTLESTKKGLIAAIEANTAKGLYSAENPAPTIRQGKSILYSPSDPAAGNTPPRP